jgi:hypothetical protein
VTAVAKWEQPALPAPAVGRDIVDGWAHQVAAVAKLATYIAATDFVPKAYRGQDAAVAAAILAGREMGIGPMTALQHLYVVDGRPAMSAQLMRALVFAHGHTIRVVECNSERCTLVGRRAGDSHEAPVTWSMEDARRAQVSTRTNWARYPRQMLLARATGELCRAVFPDVIGGMAYTLEEADDIPAAEDGTTTPPPRTVRRSRRPGPAPSPTEGPVSTSPPAGADSDPAGGEPPPLPEDESTPRSMVTGDSRLSAPVGSGGGPSERAQNPTESAEPAEPDQPPAGGPEELSEAQRAHLFRLFTELDRMTPRAERLRVASALTGRHVESLNGLTRTEATSLIDVLVRCAEQPDMLEPLVTEGEARLDYSGGTAPLWEDEDHAHDDDGR